MVSKLIEFNNERELSWKKFVAWCSINEIKVGEKTLDLIENFLKRIKF